jgi:hypothetical protein
LYQMRCISPSTPQQHPLRQIRQERGDGKGPRLPYKQEDELHEQDRWEAENGLRKGQS